MLDRRIEETVAGLQRSVGNKLRSIGEANVATIVEYITAMKGEVNLSNNYRKDIIEILYRFSEHFRDLTRANVLAFLDTFRKTARFAAIGQQQVLNSIRSMQTSMQQLTPQAIQRKHSYCKIQNDRKKRTHQIFAFFRTIEESYGF